VSGTRTKFRRHPAGNHFSSKVIGRNKDWGREKVESFLCFLLFMALFQHRLRRAPSRNFGNQVASPTSCLAPLLGTRRLRGTEFSLLLIPETLLPKWLCPAEFLECRGAGGVRFRCDGDLGWPGGLELMGQVVRAIDRRLAHRRSSFCCSCTRFKMQDDPQLERAQKKRMRYAEGKLREAQQRLSRAERSILYWSRVLADLRHERIRAIQSPLWPEEETSVKN